MIEISIGSDDGLKEGHTVEVYRGQRYLGRAKIVQTAPDKSVGKILPRSQNGPIQVGDRVATKLRVGCPSRILGSQTENLDLHRPADPVAGRAADCVSVSLSGNQRVRRVRQGEGPIRATAPAASAAQLESWVISDPPRIDAWAE